MTLDEVLKLMAALTPIVLGVLTYYTAKANANAVSIAKDATMHAKRVEDTLAQTTDTTTGQLEVIHELVNSRLSQAMAKIERLEEALRVEGERDI